MPTKRKQLQQYQVEKILQKRNIILFYQCNNVNKKQWELVKKGLLSTLKSKVSDTADTQLRTDLLMPFVTLLVKNRLGHRCATSARLDVERSFLINNNRTTEDSISMPSLDRQSKDVYNLCCKHKERAKRSLLSLADNACKLSRKKSIEREHWCNLFQGPTLLFACNSHHQMLAGCDAIAKNTNWHSSISLLGGMYYGKLMTHLDFIQLCKLDQGVYAVLTSSLTESVELLLNQRLSFYQSRLLFYLDCHATNLGSTREKKDN